MKIFKTTIVFFFALATVAYAGYSFYLYSLTTCERPLEYAIGRFDTQFGLSYEDFKSNIATAEGVWEKAVGRDIFVYNPQASFKINLIYDERQIVTIQKQKTESGLSVVETAFKRLDAEFTYSKSQYERQVALYKQDLASYEERKAAYDKNVSYWNTRGGAPADIYASLEKERQYLNTEAQRLNEVVSSTKTLAAQLNNLLEARNSKAAEYNRTAQEYNKKYNQKLEFNQAEYNGQEINIYQFSNREDLILAISHEFGHALNMDHVENPKSIMYYLTGINADTNPTLSEEDLAELQTVCKTRK